MNFMANFRKMKHDKLLSKPPLANSKPAHFHKNEPKQLRQDHIEGKVAFSNFLDEEIVTVQYCENL